MWGYAIREEACAVVGKLAHTTLPRNGRRAQALSAVRVEQIYKAWRDSERRRRHWTTGNDEGALQERWRYQADYLKEARPRRGRGIEFYARKLLANGGTWRHAPPRWMPFREPQLTPKAERELLQMPRIRRGKTG